MSYTQDFCAEIHKILVVENNEDGREKVRQRLENFSQTTFIEQFAGRTSLWRNKLNEDPTTGAVVLSHVVGAGTMSPPHDHGNPGFQVKPKNIPPRMGLWTTMRREMSHLSRPESIAPIQPSWSV